MSCDMEETLISAAFLDFYECAGNGAVSCSPSVQIAELAAAYQTYGVDQLACPEGTDVLYPTSAPGFIDDPTGWSKKQVTFYPLAELFWIPSGAVLGLTTSETSMSRLSN